MKNTLYDRLESAITERLFHLRDLFIGMIEHREKTPRFDFHGKCVIRCTQILEERGALPLPSPTRQAGSSSTKETD